jgi:lipopolysaccharide transport system ATP-binding protein
MSGKGAAIEVRDLGKQFVIGRKEKYTTLRGKIAGSILNPGTWSNGSKSSNSKREYIWALKGISFDVEQGEVVGIIGRNGAGKSTLLKIISRITQPTEGYAQIRGRVGALLEVGTGFHPELTGRENVYLNGAILGMKHAEIESRFEEIVDFAEVHDFLDTPIKHYSSGMHLRLAFAVAAHLNPEILIVDEVLAVGDAAFQRKCMGKVSTVAREGRTVLFVSHNMSAIQDLCTKVILLDKGNIIAQGPVQEIIGRYLSEGTSSTISFDDGAIRRAAVQQVGEDIELVVEYSMPMKIAFPNLGFVISDYMGHPICGSNPRIERLEDQLQPTSEGTIRVIVQHPKLLNGTYRVSLWFSDGKTNFFKSQDCLVFEVTNMAKLRQMHSSSAIGPVVPQCRWSFE